MDGSTTVEARGTTIDAFNLGGFDFGIGANGPNLADLGYLFHLIVPNSPPFRLNARAKSDGDHFSFSNMSGVIGHTDVRGWIRSDHSHPRRRILAAFMSKTLDRNDVEALLAPVPPRAVARSMSGTVKVTTGSHWLLPDAPFGLSRIRATDFDFYLRAETVSNFALPIHDLSTRVSLEQGVLRFDHFISELYGGRLDGNAQLDARADVPRLAIAGRLTGARLAQTMAGTALGSNARLDLNVDVSGRGRSVHDAAGRASGAVDLRLSDATIPRRAAWIMGGDLLRAMGASDKAAAMPLTCAAVNLRGAGGPFSIRNFKVQTTLGMASGAGTVDFGSEQVHIVMQGHSREKRLFQVATPLKIDGPLMKPVLTVLPADHARKLGLRGKFGIVLSPIVGLLPLGHDKLPSASTDVGC